MPPIASTLVTTPGATRFTGNSDQIEEGSINLFAKLRVTTDWNTALTPGKYTGVDAANAPTTGAYSGEVYIISEFITLQIVYRVVSGSLETYRRVSEEVTGVLTFVDSWELVTSSGVSARRVLNWNDELEVGFVYAFSTAINNPLVDVGCWGEITRLENAGSPLRVTQQADLIQSGVKKTFSRWWHDADGWSGWLEHLTYAPASYNIQKTKYWGIRINGSVDGLNSGLTEIKFYSKYGKYIPFSAIFTDYIGTIINPLTQAIDGNLSNVFSVDTPASFSYIVYGTNDNYSAEEVGYLAIYKGYGDYGFPTNFDFVVSHDTSIWETVKRFDGVEKAEGSWHNFYVDLPKNLTDVEQVSNWYDIDKSGKYYSTFSALNLPVAITEGVVYGDATVDYTNSNLLLTVNHINDSYVLARYQAYRHGTTWEGWVEVTGGSTITTIADLPNIATNTVLGRATAGAGAIEELTPSATKTLLGLNDTDGLSEGTTNKYFTNVRTIAATLTSFVAEAGTVSATDSILQALQKIVGNIATLTTSSITEGSNLYFTNARTIASVLTGFSAGAGTVAATDSLLQAIQKIVGNLTNKLDNSSPNLYQIFPIAISDTTTALTVGTVPMTFLCAANMDLTAVQASVNTVSSSGNPTFDVKKNGTTIFSTKVSIDSGEQSSTTATTPSVLTSNPVSCTKGDLLTFSIDVAGTGAKQATIYLTAKVTGGV